MNDKQRKAKRQYIQPYAAITYHILLEDYNYRYTTYCGREYNSGEAVEKKTPLKDRICKQCLTHFAAHDTQPSGEIKELKWKIQELRSELHGISTIRGHNTRLKKRIEELESNTLANRDPGKVEALIEKAKFVNDYRLDYLYESLEALDADTSPTPLFVILRTFLRFAKELKVALKGVSNGK